MKKEILLFLFICPLVFFYVFSHNIKKARTASKTHITLSDSFNVLQGSEVDAWNYVQTYRDYEDLEYYKSVYDKNQHLQFNSSPTFKIPKTVHLIWIGPKPFPLESIPNVRSWMAHHPDWTFIFWTDRKRPAPCNGMQVRYLDQFEFKFLKDKFEECKNWGEKSDIWRYEILYREGGVYIDHDAKCLRPFHGLHTGYDFYACLEMPHEGIDNLALTAGIGIIGARAGHPVLRSSIEHVLNRWDEVTKKFSASDPLVQARRVAHRTYIALTYAFRNNLNQPGYEDIVFPACYFYPKYGLPGLYSDHLYGTSWHNLNESPNEKDLSNTFRVIRNRDAKIIRVELFSLVALISCFTLNYFISRKIKEIK